MVPEIIESQFDLSSLINPTYGWLACDHFGKPYVRDEIPTIILRDFGIAPSKFSYVGIVDYEWFVKRNDKHRFLNGTVGALGAEQFPPKLLFDNAFLERLPQYTIIPDVDLGTPECAKGRLKWYITAKMADEKTDRHDMFVNCISMGIKFVWQLKNEGSCENLCHTAGYWRD